jgi:hypothetical protein
MRPLKTSGPLSLSRLAALGLLALAAGCNLASPPEDDPTRYYVLSDAGGSDAHAAQAPGTLRIGLRAVGLEGYLKNRQFVVRTGANEVDFRDYRRWAEPLDAAISRMLRAKLLASPGVGQVSCEPFPLEQERDFDVSVEILRFEGDVTAPGRASANLTALIEVSTTGADSKVVVRKRFVAPAAAWDGSSFDQLAGLLSHDVAALGQEIASDIPAKD